MQLNRDQTHQLGRTLHTIETLTPHLNTLLTTRPTPPNIPTHAAPGPRPPLPIHILDTKLDTEQIVIGWATNLATDLHQPPPQLTSAAHAAAWLHQHIHQLAEQNWATDAADELHDVADTLTKTINPTTNTEGITPPTNVEGTARHISNALKLMRINISHTTLRKLAKQGKLTTRQRSDGAILFQLHECANYAKTHTD